MRVEEQDWRHVVSDDEFIIRI